jgi:hypothetical protein
MDISSESALERISKWEIGSTSLGIIAKLGGLRIHSLAKVSSPISESKLTLTLEGDGRLIIDSLGELSFEEEETLLPKDGATSVLSTITIRFPTKGYCRLHELPDHKWPSTLVSELIQ